MKERVKRTSLESLMTARQVADFLQVSVCTVGRWSRQGSLKFYRIGGRGDMRYRLEDVIRFLDDSSGHSVGDRHHTSDLSSGKGVTRIPKVRDRKGVRG